MYQEDKYKLFENGCCLESIKNYLEMEKCYLEAIKLGCENSMNNLGYYHHHITKDYPKMGKYYLMAIDLGSIISMYNIACYYRQTNNYTEMKKYFLMAIELNCVDSMQTLAEILRRGDCTISNEYYLMAIYQNSEKAIQRLSEIYHNNNNYLFDILDNAYLKKSHHLLLEKLNELILLPEIKKHILPKIEIKKSSDNPIFKKLYYNYVINNQKCKRNDNFTLIVYCNEIRHEYFIQSMVLNSDYFWTLLEGEFQSKNEVTINIKNLQVIDVLLKYLYLSEFNSFNGNKDDINDLIRICDEFGFDDLKSTCEIILRYNFEYKS